MIRSVLRIAFMAGALACCSSASEAQATSGNTMFKACIDAERHLVNEERGKLPDAGETVMLGVCLGEVMGIKFLAAGATKNTEYPVCVPATATNGQVLAVVVRHLRNHPETRDSDFNYLVMDALLEAWPCQKH
jgi:hypothetical protein